MSPSWQASEESRLAHEEKYEYELRSDKKLLAYGRVWKV